MRSFHFPELLGPKPLPGNLYPLLVLAGTPRALASWLARPPSKLTGAVSVLLARPQSHRHVALTKNRTSELVLLIMEKSEKNVLCS